MQHHFAAMPREAAKTLGLKRYTSYESCPLGHFPIRYVCDGQCVQCTRDKIRARYLADPAKWSQVAREYRAKNLEAVSTRNAARARKLRKEKPDVFAEYDRRKHLKIMSDPLKHEREKARCREKARRAYERDPEKFRQRSRDMRKDPIVLERGRIKSREYKKLNPEVMAKLNRKHSPLRRAAKIQRTPRWLTDEHKREMSDIYERAHGMGLHVDHVVPLRGKLVSGLHVPWNLQMLTPTENSRKRNKFEVDQ